MRLKTVSQTRFSWCCEDYILDTGEICAYDDSVPKKSKGKKRAKAEGGYQSK